MMHVIVCMGTPKIKGEILENSNEHYICFSSPLWLSVYGRSNVVTEINLQVSSRLDNFIGS